MMAAQPYIAEWIGKHPEWMAKKWSCDYPGHEKRRIGLWPGVVTDSIVQFGPKAIPQGNSPT